MDHPPQTPDRHGKLQSYILSVLVREPGKVAALLGCSLVLLVLPGLPRALSHLTASHETAP